MKRCICIFFIVFGMLATTNAQFIPKVEKVDIFVPNLIIKDNLFLCGLDSLIFNSICPEIKTQRNNYKIFDVWSKKNKEEENSYTLVISLTPMVQIYKESDLRGYFNYRDYLFLWFYDVPEELFVISDQKRKLTYTKGVPYLKSDHTEFTFDYTNSNLVLTGICCY